MVQKCLKNIGWEVRKCVKHVFLCASRLINYLFAFRIVLEGQNARLGNEITYLFTGSYFRLSSFSHHFQVWTFTLRVYKVHMLFVFHNVRYQYMSLISSLPVLRIKILLVVGQKYMSLATQATYCHRELLNLHYVNLQNKTSLKFSLLYSKGPCS